MENHPIPQDVTGFQFKLIGDMTIKQFAYVATGAILAFVCFYAPISPFIKLPIGVVFGLFGAALAFLPLEGRPVDAMVSYFIKALVTPNQYAYHKIGGSIALFAIPAVIRTPAATAAIAAKQKTFKTVDENKAAQLQEYLHSVQKHTTSPLDEKEQLFLQHALTGSVQSIDSSPSPLQVSPTAPANQPIKADTPLTPKEMEEQEANLALEAASVKYELNEAKEHEAKEKDAAKVATTHQQVTTLEQKLSSLLAQKEEIEKELALLKTPPTPIAQPAPATIPATPQPTLQHSEEQIAVDVAQQLSPTPAPVAQTTHIEPLAAPTPTAAPTIRKIPADMAKSIGLPRMPEVPNLIVGIVKDPRGNILQNILVEVKDKEGIPARAFRTNSLGQFASATPLSNGSYTIEFEDPKTQHKFDVVEIIAQGEIMLPLEIISHDAREELRKELFS